MVTEDDGGDRIRTESSGSAGTRSSGEGSTSERPRPPPLPMLLPLPLPLPAPGRIKTFGSMTTQSCSALQSTWIQRLRPVAKQQERAHQELPHGEIRSSDVRPEERLSRFPYSCGSSPSSRSQSASFPPRSHGAGAGRGVSGSSPLGSRPMPPQRLSQGGCFAENKACNPASAGEGTSRPGGSQRRLQNSENYTYNEQHSGRCLNPAQGVSSESMQPPAVVATAVATAIANSETAPIFRSSSEMDTARRKGKAAVRAEEAEKMASAGPESGRLLGFSRFEQSVESNSAETASTQSLPKALLEDLCSELCSRSAPNVCEACRNDKLGMRKFRPWPKDDCRSEPVGTAMGIDPATAGRRSKSNDNDIRSSPADDTRNGPGCFGEGVRCDVQVTSPSSAVKNVPSSMDPPFSYDICGPSSWMDSRCNIHGVSQSLALEHSSDLGGKAARGNCTSGTRGLHLPLFNSNLFLAAKENYKYSYQSCSNKLENVKGSSNLGAEIPNATQAANLSMSSVKEKPLQNRSTIDASLMQGSFQGSLKTAGTEFTRSITGLGKESDEGPKGGTRVDQPCLSSLMWLHHWHCSSLGAAQQLKLYPEPKESFKSTCTIKTSMDSKSPDAFGSLRIPEDAVADRPSERDPEKGNVSHMTSPQKLGIGTARNLWPFPEYGSSEQVDCSQPGARGIFEQASSTPSAAAMSMIGSTRRQICTFIFGGKRAAAKQTEEESTHEIERQRPG